MHPSDEQLIRHLEDRRIAETGRHLEAGCPRCQRRLEQIRRLITTMRADRDADPPATWVARAVALRTRESDAPALSRLRDWVGGLREEIAALISDTFSGPPELALSGLRAVGSARRLRFETEAVELDLQIESERDAALVTGQFATIAPSPRPIGHASFLIVAGDHELVEGKTDRLGEFSVEVLREAPLQLRLRHLDCVLRFDVPLETAPEP